MAIPVNGWFPRIGPTAIASGNAGIYLTPLDGSAPSQVSPVGIGPIWAGPTLVYSLGEAPPGRTQVGGTILPIAYQDYRGSPDDRWAGVSAGVITCYRGPTVVRTISNAYSPRFWTGDNLGWITADHTKLVINDVVCAAPTVPILEWAVPLDGGFSVYQVPGAMFITGTEVQCQIRADEAPIAAFTQGGIGWLVTGTGIAGGMTFVRPVQSPLGYAISGILNFPDAKMQPDGRLLVVGSDDAGHLRQVWIDFSAPRQDLSQIVGPLPPEPEPQPPEPTPIPPTPLPIPSYTPLKEIPMPFPETRAGVLGPGGAYGRPDVAANRIVFDQDQPSDQTHVEITKPDANGMIRFVQANKIINFPGSWGADSPSGGFVRQFELRDPDQRAADESPTLRHVDGTPNDMVFVVHGQGAQGLQFPSAPLFLGPRL